MNPTVETHEMIGFFDYCKSNRETIHAWRGALVLEATHFFYLYSKSVGGDWPEILFELESWQ